MEDILKKSQDRLKKAMPGGGGVNNAFLALILLFGAAVLAFFLFTVRIGPDEQGIVTRFGQFTRQLEPGLNFRLPPPVEAVYVVKPNFTNTVGVGLRVNPDSSFRRSGDVREVNEEALMLTGDNNIVKVQFTVQWQIGEDPSEFLFNVENVPETVKEVAESAMREVVGKSKLDVVLTENFAANALAVKELMQETLNSYNAGVSINAVLLRRPDAPDQVIEAFNDVEAAKQVRERLQREAERDRNRIVPEARGEAQRILEEARAYKSRVVEEARGEAERFNKIYAEYSKAPEVTRQRLFLETMERVYSTTDKVIIGGDRNGGGTGVVPYLPLDQLNRRSNSGQNN
ncbi:MAG: FtsH protease activity modulator HflK [Pseudomonadota bacterium]